MRNRSFVWVLASFAAIVVAGLVAVAALKSGSVPDPLAPGLNATAASLDIGVLVFREGLEFILVLAALTANLSGGRRSFQRPVVLGVTLGLVATLVTWHFAVGLVDSLSENLPALHVQALTGLLAVLVLITVMNWFFHKIYWTGWMSLHSRKKQELLRMATESRRSRVRIWCGLAVLGLTSVYREGFEVVLFLQSYRLKLGNAMVGTGVSIGVVLTVLVAFITFVANQKLPYRKMLVLTGVLLGLVLLVMVGEQAQEMQLAHWLPTTNIAALDGAIPGWMRLWFAVFPTVETLIAQGIAAVIVLGSYVLAGRGVRRRARMAEQESTAPGLIEEGFKV